MNVLTRQVRRFAELLGVCASAQGGTGLDASSAAAGELLVGTGTGFALATLGSDATIAVTPGAGTLSLAVAAIPTAKVTGLDAALAAKADAAAGLPPGGTAGQVIAKVDGADFNTQWADPPAGGGGSPGGPEGSIQFNDGAGGFAGSAATVTAEGAITVHSSSRSPLEAHVGDENWNVGDFFNDTYSTTTPIFSYFTRNVGIFEMGTWDAKEFRFFTSGYTNSRLIIAANGNVVAGVPSYPYAAATTVPSQFQVVNTNAAQPTMRLVRKSGQSADQLEVVEPDGTTVVGGIGASGAYRLPVLVDADAEDNTIFLGSDHPDGSSKPQLCRKQGGVVTPIG